MARVQYAKPKGTLFLAWGTGSIYDWHAVIDGPADPKPGDTIMVRHDNEPDCTADKCGCVSLTAEEAVAEMMVLNKIKIPEGIR